MAHPNKKSFNILAYLPLAGLFITIIGFLITGVSGYNKLQAQAENTKEKVKEVDEKVEDLKKDNKEDLEKAKKDSQEDIDKLKEENKEFDKAIVAQTIRLENIQQLLQTIDKKLEKKK